MKIQNNAELAVTPLRVAGLQILEAGLTAIDTTEAIRNRVQYDASQDVLTIDKTQFPLAQFERVFVVGIGKCSLLAAEALETVLGDRLTGGQVIDIKPGTLKKIKVTVGTHPMPSEQNIQATRELLELLRTCTERDLVLTIISGGGTTLICQPNGSTAEDEAILVKTLFKAGAVIEELNTVRRHLSVARGGGLAVAAGKARMIALIFSDVASNDLQMIASGPTVLDTTTVADAEAVIIKYGLTETAPSVYKHLIETPKDPGLFSNITNILFVTNVTALAAMKETAEQLGYATTIVENNMKGEARTVGHAIIEQLHASGEKTAWLYGGETTVTITGNGTGGRNQEMVLASLSEVREHELMISCGSDGHDNTDVAGAVCDTITKDKAAQRGLSAQQYLQTNDSYPFFRATGDAIITGDTGTNVADLIIAIHE